MFVCAPCADSASVGRQKRALDDLELELQSLESHHDGDERVASVLSHLSSPGHCVFKSFRLVVRWVWSLAQPRILYSEVKPSSKRETCNPESRVADLQLPCCILRPCSLDPVCCSPRALPVFLLLFREPV